MKIIPFLFLLFSFQSSEDLATGTYVSKYDKKSMRGWEQTLSLNKDHSFTRTYFDVKMCIGKVEEWDVGTWYLDHDELVLIDTLIYPASVNTITARIFGTTDTAIVRHTKFRIKKNGRLHFLNSNAGKARYDLPDFIYRDDSENKRSRMLPFY